MNLLFEFIRLYINRENDYLLEKFIQYEKILLDWNKKINLISRKQQGIEKIILDSIFFLSDYKFCGNEHIIDIGTGGGFPGIPLKIIFPELKITLLDSIQKKTKALNYIVSELKLNDVIVVCERAENLSRSIDYKEKYDVVISRAVSDLTNLYKWGMGFLKQKGHMICIKGGDIEKELNDFKLKFPDEKPEVRSYSLNSFLPDYNLLDKKDDESSKFTELKHIIIMKKGL